MSTLSSSLVTSLRLTFTAQYLRDVAEIIDRLDHDVIEDMADRLRDLRDGGGRLFQAVVWHLLVSHPKLQLMPNKWESSQL